MVIGLGWRRRRSTDEAARDLYDAIVDRARQPFFYADLGVPDSLDGRFELVILHAFLVMRRLKAEGTDDAATVGQALYDVMFADMDESLREIGVGDLSIGKKVRAMTEAFRGRTEAYDAALNDAERSALAEALRRNLYGTAAASPAQLDRMAAVVRAVVAALAAQAGKDVSAGRIAFGTVPGEV